MPPPAYTTQANQALNLLAQFDPGMNAINQVNRNRIIDNVYSLWNSTVSGHYYQNFFGEILQILGNVPANQIPNHNLRVSTVFLSKLVAPYVNDHSLGTYLGGASEILDTVRALGRQGAVPNRLSVPQGNKIYEQVDWQPLGTTQIPQALQQDVDRTEVHGNVKYYVEVKADSRTAVHKIGTSGVTQLEGIRAVIANRTRRSQNQGIFQDHFNRHGRVLRPGVAITNPAGWLELFTSGVIALYYNRQFYLLIDNQIIAPANLRQIHDDLWTSAGLQLPALNYYQIRSNQNVTVRNRMNDVLAALRDTFPSPSALAQAQFQIAGLVNVPPAQQPQPIPQAPPPPP